MQYQVKCNIHANWRNDKLNCGGGSWITKNHQEKVGDHAHEAVTSYHDRVTAEMRLLIWILQNLKDLHIQEVVIGSDLSELVEAIKGLNDWSRYGWLLHQVAWLTLALPLICFEIESYALNQVARERSKSVLRMELQLECPPLGASWPSRIYTCRKDRDRRPLHGEPHGGLLAASLAGRYNSCAGA
ncbi:hypothetical protein Bca52824_082746 [Brassica carinata]|uniref:RNase H type-1 domain-containing protein n=1 Tax=Brassica carinata TaxID=52824 RepID=A0A8X7PK21_BRACI|nr:hypothetical protein Bca52824_082746 [Brassica carinata]